MSKNTHLSVRGVLPGIHFALSFLIRRDENPTKCAASYWDFLPAELQDLCYELNHKRAMREVLEQMKEDLSLSNPDGLGGWEYHLNCSGFRPFDSRPSGSRRIAIDYDDYLDYYGIRNYSTDDTASSDEDEDEDGILNQS